MSTTLRILIIDDSESDTKLIIHHLELAGLVNTHKRVESASEMRAALEKGTWNIVISDYSMHKFDALAALRIIQESGRDIPFIVVSGVIGEDATVEMMKAGANDYVMKGNLSRLVPAIHRELAEAEERRGKKQIEKALRQSEERYRALYEDNPSMYFTIDTEGTVLSVNQFGAKELGYSVEELLGRQVLDVFHPDDREAVRQQLIMCVQNPEQVVRWQFRKVRKDGSILWVKEVVRSVHGIDGNPVVLVVCEDITEQRQSEEALRESEERYRGVVENIGLGVALISPKMEILTLNNQARKWLPDVDISRKTVCYKAIQDPSKEGACLDCPVYRTLQDGQVHESVMERQAGNEIRSYRKISSPVKDRDGNIVAAVEMVEDITESIISRNALRDIATKYRTIFESTGTAIMIVDNDATISLMNSESEKLIGYSKKEVESKKNAMEFVAKHDLVRLMEYHRLRNVNPEASPRNYEFQLVDKNGRIKDIFITIGVIQGSTKKIVSLLDITERKQSEELLKKRENDLEEKSLALEELNTALKVLLKQREQDRDEFEKWVLSNVENLVLPYIQKLKELHPEARSGAFINILESNLKNITSSFAHKLSPIHINFTSKELQIANLIREGKSSKDISELLNISVRTVDFHRKHMRDKLGLQNRRESLRSFLVALS